MAEQPELAIDPLPAPRIVLDQVEIFELSRECVARKRCGLRERLAIRTDPATREVKGDGGEASFGQLASEIWKERPMCEALEAVTDDDRGQRGLGAVHFAADGEAIIARKVERLGFDRVRCRQSTISPSISAHP